MAITMRNTKAQMFAEIERLRERCESLEAALRAASQPERSLEPSERRAKLEALKAFATKFRCSARLRDGVIELYSKQRGCWVAAPEAQP
jgi:hypothetical protein